MHNPYNRHSLARQLMGLGTTFTTHVEQQTPSTSTNQTLIGGGAPAPTSYVSPTLLKNYQDAVAQADMRPTAAQSLPVVTGFVVEAEDYAVSAARELAAAESEYKLSKQPAVLQASLAKHQEALALIQPLIVTRVEKATTLAKATQGDTASLAPLLVRLRTAANSAGFAYNRVQELVGLAAHRGPVVTPDVGADVGAALGAGFHFPVWGYAVGGALILGLAMLAPRKKKAS